MTYFFTSLPLLFFFARAFLKLDADLSAVLFTASLALCAWSYYKFDEKDKHSTDGVALCVLALFGAASYFISDYRHEGIFNDNAAFVLYTTVMVIASYVKRTAKHK